MHRIFLLFIVVVCAENVRGQLPPGLAKSGVVRSEEGICPGYVLISPLSSWKTFLIDQQGRIVHQWLADRKPGQSAYLLNDGTLLRAGKVEDTFQFPSSAGSGGSIQKYDWDGNLIWHYTTSSKYRMSHHDIEPLPNGNVLCIVWESYLRKIAEDAGRNPERLLGDVLWFEAIFELKPKGLRGAEVVWKWSLRDHLVQDWSQTKENYGDPAEHPELMDINYMSRPVADWVHMNSIDYNPELDQIMVSSRSLSEFWIIDHSTTTDEAKGHAGGRAGRGGDLLYRWGNPQVYRRGTSDDRMLFGPHDAHWIPDGLNGAGNILVFNNGLANTEQDFSSADELKLPLNKDGTYRVEENAAYGPADIEWTFEDPGKLFSPRISGAQRLPNGNTLVCSGTQHLILEVTPESKIVWMYRNPPRYRTPPGRKSSAPSPSELTDEQRDALRIPGGVPLDDGGTMFRAIKYPLNHPAFEGRRLKPQPATSTEPTPKSE